MKVQWIAVLAGGGVVVLAACRTTKTITGRVTDFRSGLPMSGVTVQAVQNGWGWSRGPVWDKDYLTSATTDTEGRFLLPYRVGGSANLVASLHGYNVFRHWYEPSTVATIRLKGLVHPPKMLPTDYLRVGIYTDGRLYGWNFGNSSVVASPGGADVFPALVESGENGRIVLRATGKGGLHFVTQSKLGVDDQFLVYADSAPETGYIAEATIDFSGKGGLYFVRTRDGEHYAKFEFYPDATASTADRGVARDLMLRFVYNPPGSRALSHDEPPLNRTP